MRIVQKGINTYSRFSPVPNRQEALCGHEDGNQRDRAPPAAQQQHDDAQIVRAEEEGRADLITPDEHGRGLRGATVAGDHAEVIVTLGGEREAHVTHGSSGLRSEDQLGIGRVAKLVHEPERVTNGSHCDRRGEQRARASFGPFTPR
jgi:hypothetical protein